MSELSELYFKVSSWLFEEAELLDSLGEAQWFAKMVDPSISYRVPLRQTTRRAAGPGFIDGAFHLDETWGSLQTRIRRLESDYAWAEDPPARARHFISNIKLGARHANGIEVRSNVLLSRTRLDQANPALIAGDRHDLLLEHGDSYRLARRTVFLDVSVIETPNLAVIF